MAHEEYRRMDALGTRKEGVQDSLRSSMLVSNLMRFE